MIRRLIRKIALLSISDGKLLVVRKRDHSLFILPGGKPEDGEADLDALHREVMEETGCTISNVRPDATYRAAAAEMDDADVEIVAFLGDVDGSPVPSGEIEEIGLLDIADPDLPVAPSISDEILPVLRRRAASALFHRTPEWKVHVPLLFSETLSNPNMGALRIPFSILLSSLHKVATRAMTLGDVVLDDMMIRLALYAQGDPHDPDYDPGSAIRINEQAVRERHRDHPDIEEAISGARDHHPDWNGCPERDWRRGVGQPIRLAWTSMPFASRVAVVLSQIDADRELLS